MKKQSKVYQFVAPYDRKAYLQILKDVYNQIQKDSYAVSRPYLDKSDGTREMSKCSLVVFHEKEQTEEVVDQFVQKARKLVKERLSKIVSTATVEKTDGSGTD